MDMEELYLCLPEQIARVRSLMHGINDGRLRIAFWQRQRYLLPES
jgi:hypothetical protein